MRHFLLITTLFASSLFTTACGKKAADADAAVSVAQAPASKSLDPDDPCRLLSAAEAEAVLGAPLATPPYRSYGGMGDLAGTPHPTSDVCWYETGDHRNLTVSLSRSNGGSVMKGVAGVVNQIETNTKARFQDGTELAGEWDEAKVLNCCTFMALRGDTLVEIDTGGADATPQQIASLADSAIKRLDAPLAYDSSLGLKAAEAFYAKRPKAGDPCSVLSKADIEAVFGGPVQGEPQASGNDCTWTYLNPKSKGQGSGLKDKIPEGTMTDEELKMLSGFMGALGGSKVLGEKADGSRTDSIILTTTWRNGYRSYRVENQMIGGIAAGFGGEMGDTEGAKLGKSQTLQGPWDMAQSSAVQFNSVKNDVAIAVRPGTLDAATYQALMQRAYANLQAGSK